MSDMDNFFRGLQIFSEGMDRVARNNALDRSQEQIADLQTQNLDIAAKRQHQTQIANNLAMDLLRTNTPATSIQMAVGAVGPSQIASPEQAIMQGMLNGDQRLVEMGKQATIAEAAPKMQMQTQLFKQQADLEMMKEKYGYNRTELLLKGQMDRAKIQGDTAKQKQITNMTSDRQKEFNRYITKDLTSLNSAEQIQTLLQQKNALVDNSLPTFFARASGEVGNLSEADKAPFGGNQGTLQKLRRWSKLKAGEPIPEADRADMQKMSQVFARVSSKNIKNKALQISGQLSGNLGGKAEDYVPKLVGEEPRLQKLFMDNPALLDHLVGTPNSSIQNPATNSLLKYVLPEQ